MTIVKIIIVLYYIIPNSSATNTSYFEVTACYNKTLTRNLNKPRVVDRCFYWISSTPLVPLLVNIFFIFLC